MVSSLAGYMAGQGGGSEQTSPARPRLEVSFWSDLARPTTGSGYETDVSWANTSTRLPVLVFFLLLGALII